MIVSALVAAGGRYLGGKAKAAASGEGSSSDLADPIEQKLAQVADGTKMDANPDSVRLAPALAAEKKEKSSSSSSSLSFSTSDRNDSSDVDILTSRGSNRNAAQKHLDALNALRARCHDLSDILELASDHRGKFIEQFFDARRHIRISTRTFPSFPVDMVKAVVYVPCSPRHFLSLLEFPSRILWDETFRGGEVLLQEGADCCSDEKTRHHGGDGGGGSSSGGAACAGELMIKMMRFDAFPGMIKPRDFELGVFTRMDAASGAAYVKAVSTPSEFGLPVPPGTVRGFIPVSGFVAKPVPPKPEVLREIHRDASSSLSPSSAFSSFFSSSSSSAKTAAKTISSSSAPDEDDDLVHSEVTYVALVHPRGGIPVFLLNLIIGKQTSGLRNLQLAAANRVGFGGTAATAAAKKKQNLKSKI